MKILYIDVSLDGHHKIYLDCLLDINSYNENFVMLPVKNFSSTKCKHFYSFNYKAKNIFSYFNMLKLVKKIVKQEKIDVVHFLYGDSFYRYFGIGLKGIKAKLLVTFHCIRRSFLRDYSVRRIFKAIDVGVVHTDSLKDMLNHDFNIKNVKHIEYPYFGLNLNKTKETSKNVLGIKTDNKILACLCGTRSDKGLDIMLEALKEVKGKFHLLIAGTEESFDKNFIENMITSYKDNVTVLLKYLTDEELYHCVNCADFIVLPYRKIFNGASGPLTEGVALGKTIIGPNHGSLGGIIENNHLGYTFEAENIKDLSTTIEKALQNIFKYDTIALDYKESLNSKNFQKEYEEIYKELL